MTRIRLFTSQPPSVTGREPCAKLRSVHGEDRKHGSLRHFNSTGRRERGQRTVFVHSLYDVRPACRLDSSNPKREMCGRPADLDSILLIVRLSTKIRLPHAEAVRGALSQPTPESKQPLAQTVPTANEHSLDRRDMDARLLYKLAAGNSRIWSGRGGV